MRPRKANWSELLCAQHDQANPHWPIRSQSTGLSVNVQSLLVPSGRINRKTFVRNMFLLGTVQNNLIAMASNLVAMASNLIAMASMLLLGTTATTHIHKTSECGRLTRRGGFSSTSGPLFSCCFSSNLLSGSWPGAKFTTHRIQLQFHTPLKVWV